MILQGNVFGRLLYLKVWHKIPILFSWSVLMSTWSIQLKNRQHFHKRS